MASMKPQFIREFRVGDVLFRVNIEGIVTRAIALSFGTNMKIPYEFEDGIKIHTISSQVCEGHFSTVEIDDRIPHVSKSAFHWAHVEKVVWPANCKVIPYQCFCGSDLKEICNIDGVITVEEAAFWGTKMDSLDWPSNCVDIPTKCFSKSCLRILNNIGHIASIGDYAFWDALCINKLDFSASPINFVGECAFEGTPAGGVHLPYYIDQECERGV